MIGLFDSFHDTIVCDDHNKETHKLSYDLIILFYLNITELVNTEYKITCVKQAGAKQCQVKLKFPVKW